MIEECHGIVIFVKRRNVGMVDTGSTPKLVLMRRDYLTRSANKYYSNIFVARLRSVIRAICMIASCFYVRITREAVLDLQGHLGQACNACAATSGHLWIAFNVHMLIVYQVSLLFEKE